jgi:hypothetical protein
VIVPKISQQELKQVYDEDNIQIIEVEYPNYNSQSKCNNCGKTIFWNKGVIHRRTKRLVPLNEHYRPDVGMRPKRHLCMKDGTKDGKWINKYETDNFYRDNVVQKRDNRFLKELKIDRYNKLTGYGYVERNKQTDLSYVKEWEAYTFEY